MSDKEGLAIAYPTIEALCLKRMDATVKTALNELRANKMTPERAFHLWMEMNANDGLLKSIQVKLKVQPTEDVNG